MMIGELRHAHLTVQIPPQWDPFEDPTAEINSPYPLYTPSPNASTLLGSPDHNPFSVPDMSDDEFPDAFSCDNFRMYDFKVRRCAKSRSHDWTECPFAHSGEKARRRDPRKYSYSGSPCPEFRKGSCRKADSCEFSHGVFECWLHPDRYRTQPCRDGLTCRRRICFFAHSADQLRPTNLQSPGSGRVGSYPSESYDGSPLRRSFDSYMGNSTNNTSSFGSASPPASPPLSPTFSSSSYHELVSKMGSMQLAKAMLSPTSPWGLVTTPRVSNLHPGFCSLPTTTPARNVEEYEVEPVMERVESGRDLRTKLYARLSKENSFGPVNDTPDVGWVSDLVQ